MTRSGSLVLRRLAPADLPLARAMNALFGEVFGEADTYTALPPSDDYLRDLLASDCAIALVALEEGHVVGGLVAYELKKFEQERSEFYIYDLAVAEEHRRQGIATALLMEVQRLAKERGAWVVMVQADYEDDPAVALYSKRGVREEVLHFDLPVD